MDSEQLREIAERDQLWASLRVLQPEINDLARGVFESSQRQQQIVRILAQVVAAELDFRSRQVGPE
jgi:hypothetical protein